jgi:two-component system, LytTR family, response regulator LytT
LIKLKILIVEDEAIIGEDMRMMLEDLGYSVTGVALDFDEAIEHLENTRPDIVLSDIALGGAKDGIDLAKEIRENYQLPFIFVTSHSDRTTLERAKKHQPNGYLVKPFDSNDLFTSIEVAFANYMGQNDEDEDEISEIDSSSGFLLKDCIYVKDTHLFVKVPLHDLLWIKSEGNYLELHTLEKRHVIRSSLKEFMEKLPESQFFRVHKSFGINLKHVDAIDNALVIVAGESVPMGRNYRDLLLKYLNTV